MRTKLLILFVFLLVAASLRAQAQSLEGIWVTVLDASGILWPQVEELRIAREGGVTTAIYGIRSLPECDFEPPVQAGPCATGQTNVTGRLAIDNAKGTIAVNAPMISGTAMKGLGDPDDERLARELFWFGPGEPWAFRREANALTMSRRIQPVIPGTVLDGTKAIVIEKRFYVVDAGFAGDLIALAAAGEHSVVKMACIMPFISGKAGPAREFRALMRAVATVSQKRDELRATMYRASSSPGARQIAADKLETLGPVMLRLKAASGAPSPEDIAAVAMAFGVTTEQADRFVREIVMRPQAGPADALLFSMLKPHEAEIRTCHKQHFE